MVIEGRYYKHFKGHTYRVLGIALDALNLKPVVVYKRAGIEGLLAPTFIRSVEEFEEEVDVPHLSYSGPLFKLLPRWWEHIITF